MNLIKTYKVYKFDSFKPLCRAIGELWETPRRVASSTPTKEEFLMKNNESVVKIKK